MHLNSRDSISLLSAGKILYRRSNDSYRYCCYNQDKQLLISVELNKKANLYPPTQEDIDSTDWELLEVIKSRTDKFYEVLKQGHILQSIEYPNKYIKLYTPEYKYSYSYILILNSSGSWIALSDINPMLPDIWRVIDYDPAM